MKLNHNRQLCIVTQICEKESPRACYFIKICANAQISLFSSHICLETFNFCVVAQISIRTLDSICNSPLNQPGWSGNRKHLARFRARPSSTRRRSTCLFLWTSTRGETTWCSSPRDKTSADDELSLLLGVGGDVVGDVQVLPEGEMPGEVPPRVEVSDFSEISFTHLLAEQGIRTERIGIAGFQDKVSAAVLNLPVAQRGARFILKLNPPEFPHVVENEAFFLRAAKLNGLNAASARIVTDADGMCGLLVTRFDRVTTKEGNPRSLAMEDASQALGRPPADKYLISSEDAFTALTKLCLAPRPAARIFITQFVFAYLTGNGDAHAKNFSVLQLPTGGSLKF